MLQNHVREGLVETAVEDAITEAIEMYVALTAADMKDKPSRQMILQKLTAYITNDAISAPLTDPVLLFRRLQPRFADGWKSLT
eukprot:jgi/Psemu1/2204/gm1.2204_g